MCFPSDSDAKESACNAGDPGQEDSMEKEMAIHSSTEEPGKLQSMVSHRDRHDLSD